MLMRHTWLPEDIEAGLFVIRNSAPKDSKDLGFMRTVTYKVGFLPEQLTVSSGSGEKYVKMSVMTDGFVTLPKTKVELAEIFNNDAYGYRPATRKEITDMIMSSVQGFPYGG